MKQKRRRLILLTVLALVLAAAGYFLFRPAGGEGTYDNLIVNGDFAPGGASAAGWYSDAWFRQPDYTEYTIDDSDGFTAAHIHNAYPNDARFAQEVSVSPDTLYCLRGLIRADARDGRGANLSIAGNHLYSECLYDTGGEWQEVRLYGRTGKNQRSVTVFARLGGYSGEATGDAWFRDVTLNRVDSVPSGYYETSWDAAPAAPAEPAAQNRTGALRLILSAAAWIALGAMALRFLRRHASPVEEKAAPSRLWLGLILLSGLAARVLCALLIPGYDVDIGCFQSWASVMASAGPGGFYESVGFCDYPPGYLWLLGLLGWLGKLLGTGVTAFMVKLPPILADLLLCVFLYRFQRHAGEKSALCLALLYALNPLMIETGAAWGQADGVMTLLLFLAVVYAVRGAWKAALPLYMAAVLLKPQALMFGPLGLAALAMHVYSAWKEKERRAAALKDAGIGLGLLAAVLAAFALPMTGGQSPDWLYVLYRNTMSQYAYAAVNSCNIFYLLNQNWISADKALSWGGADGWSGLTAVFAWLLTALPLLPGLLRSPVLRPGEKTRKDCLRAGALGGAVLAAGAALAVLAALGKLTYASLCVVMVAECVALFVLLFLLGGEMKSLPLCGAGLLLLLFNASSRMHERYLAPAVALLLLGYAYQRDRRILFLAVAVTVTGFLNVGCVLDRNIRIGGVAGHLYAPAFGIESDMRFLECLSAVGNYLTGAAALWLCAALSRGEARAADALPAAGKGAPAAESRPAPLPLAVRDMKLTGRDWAVMLGATALYAVLAFANLGSLKAPQTEWHPAEPGETVTVDLGERKEFSILYFPGIQHNSYIGSSEVPATFSVSVSDDGEAWRYLTSDSVYNGDCFKWKYASQEAAEARYVQITFDTAQASYLEFLLRDPETGLGLSPAAVSSSRGSEAVSALFDEPDTLEGEPGWYNSTYFDEIYHARTAYEHLTGQYPYENTHPPLGKVMISWCVAIFGMVPFGWRFAGALAGVLMLPGMYLLGRLLLKKPWGGAAAMLLMAFDLMHFTQTRIATIDSFVVLFIIWMTYFMLRWFFLDCFGTPFWKTLIPLALSGVMMGLGVASKWTGCYAGAGLAVIFFFGLWRRFREIRAAREVPEGKRTAREAAAAQGLWRLGATAACCLVFFVAVPLGIYYLSYIPYFAPTGGVTAEKIIEAARSMLSYHSEPGRGMDHYFYSPWYEWPVIAKPMWYASNVYEPAGYQSTIMAMGNPAVWWTGLLGLVGAVCLWAARHWNGKAREIALHPASDDPRPALLLILFAAQYLPWMLVPRGTYIYHYFPSVPFIILCTGLCLDQLSERWRKAGLIALVVLLTAALALFIAFFPYASGVAVPQRWLDAMKWFPNWLWY